MDSKWVPAKGFSNYEVSSNGDIRNRVTKKILKKVRNNKGYELVHLYKDNGKDCVVMVQKLVMNSFIDYDERRLVISHRDGNRSRNSISNLILKTKSDIIKQSFKEGRRNQIHIMKPIQCVETGEIFESIAKCSKAMGISRQAISRCVNNRFLKTKEGYSFRPLD